MNVVALALAVGVVTVAAIAAAADGAMLGADPEPAPTGQLAARARRREHAHRALALTRVLAHLIAGAAIAEAFGIQRGDGLRGAAIAFAGALGTVVIVEGVGRSVGFATAPRCSTLFRPLVLAAEFVLSPILSIGSVLDSLLERLMPLPTLEERVERREEAAEQFRQVVAAEAEVTQDEEQILRGVFSLSDTSVREVMIPRVDIVGVDHVMPWSEVLDRVVSSEHARFPVYDDTLDNVIGILYSKDLLPFVIDDEEPMLGWQSLVRAATFIPTSKAIDDQLRDFKSTRSHMAIVSDEFGGTAGLVTIENVLEEIVGEIHDEYDVEEPDVEEEAGIRFWVSGGLTLEELSERLEQDFLREDVATVGGLVYDSFGRVPRAGEQMRVGAYKLVVERVRRRRIERVYFERIDQAVSVTRE